MKEGIAQYDFTARTERELTFKKGDVLALYHQVSPDWWEGHISGKDGLIPDKYIASKTGLVLCITSHGCGKCMMVMIYHNNTPMIHASIIILVELRNCLCVFLHAAVCVCVRACMRLCVRVCVLDQ